MKLKLILSNIVLFISSSYLRTNRVDVLNSFENWLIGCHIYLFGIGPYAFVTLIAVKDEVDVEVYSSVQFL